MRPEPSPDRQFLLVSEVLGRLRISRSMLYAYLDEDSRYYKPDLPRPGHVGRRTVFDKHEIDAYMSGVMQAREVGSRR